MKEVKEVVHVPTRELAEEVLAVAKENGLYEFKTSLDEMIKVSGFPLGISFEIETYCELSDYKKKNYKIITAEEFLNRFNKEEVIVNPMGVRYEECLEELKELKINHYELKCYYEKLESDYKELQKHLKAINDQPKVGDVCLFWDKDMNSYLLSVLKNVKLGTEYPYENENGLHYANCIKATDENIKAKIKELQDGN